jgi:hypothetical protein
VFVLVISVFVFACGDSGPALVDAPDSGGDNDAAVKEGPSPPLLTELQPARAQWFTSAEKVKVTGMPVAVTAPVSAVEVNGDPASYDGSVFSYAPAITPGVNVVGIRVEAEDGERTVDGRAFFHGDVHAPGAIVSEAVHVHLSPSFLDDNEPDLDDIAGVAESLLVDPAFLNSIDGAIETEYAILTPQQVTVAGAAVDVQPTLKVIHLDVVLTDLHIELEIDGLGGLGDLIAGPATIDADQAVLKVVVSVETVDGTVTVVPTFTDLKLPGFTLATEEYPDLKRKYANLHNLLHTYIESNLGDTIGSMMAELLSSLIGGFAYKTSFGDENPISIHLNTQSVSVASHGINLVLSARVSSAMGLTGAVPLMLGSLKTPNQAPSADFSTEPVAFAVDDDLLNQFTFAMWYSGALANKEFVGESLDALDLSALPAVFQPLKRIAFSMDLPLTFGRRLADDDGLPFEVSLGELGLTLETTTGKRFDLSVNARTGVGLEISPSGQLNLLPDIRPKYMNLAVGCTHAPSGVDPGSVAALVRLGFPPLLKKSAGMFSFPMLGVSLSAVSDADLLKNKELVFNSLKTRIVGPEGSLLVIEGGALFQTKAPERPTPEGQ